MFGICSAGVVSAAQLSQLPGSTQVRLQKKQNKNKNKTEKKIKTHVVAPLCVLVGRWTSIYLTVSIRRHGAAVTTGG
jgi:fructose-1,6-bisphosphatase/sedoheptulose 1,7-bisphosphatase-like protein